MYNGLEDRGSVTWVLLQLSAECGRGTNVTTARDVTAILADVSSRTAGGAAVDTAATLGASRSRAASDEALVPRDSGSCGEGGICHVVLRLSTTG